MKTNKYLMYKHLSFDKNWENIFYNLANILVDRL